MSEVKTIIFSACMTFYRVASSKPQFLSHLLTNKYTNKTWYMVEYTCRIFNGRRGGGQNVSLLPEFGLRFVGLEAERASGA